MLRPGIKSRPVYPGFNPDIKAKRNLIAAEGEGAAAILDMAAKVPADFFARTIILYCPAGSAGKQYEDKLQALQPEALWRFPTLETTMFRLKGTLDTATMGTRLYVSGTEPFIGSALQVALDHGIDHHSVVTEHRGSARRRVQCVHCKGFTENVTVNPVVCAHCGLNLLVRDHYSRRLGAFQGVCIDAEVPGELPPVEELYK
jgi:dimethylamine monooxygenase subunit C